MKKIIIIFGFLLMMPGTVFAAKTVKGTVPHLPPLQPPPPGFKVDSTQFFNGTSAAEQDSGTDTAGNTGNTAEQPAVTGESEIQNSQGNIATTEKASNHTWILIVILGFIAVVLGYAWRQRKKTS
jgi:hypothetical protein